MVNEESQSIDESPSHDAADSGSDTLRTAQAPRTPAFGRYAAQIVFASALLFALVAAVWFASRLAGANLFRQPAIRADPQVVDLGTVTADSVLPVSVNIRNAGGGQLKILAVKGSCDSCIKILDYPRRPLSAGQSGRVQLEVHTRNSGGTVRKQALILSNDWTGKPFVIPIEWTITEKPSDPATSG